MGLRQVFSAGGVCLVFCWLLGLFERLRVVYSRCLRWAPGEGYAFSSSS